jgi:GMP synthase (glutamine-hydrolysing)
MNLVSSNEVTQKAETSTITNAASSERILILDFDSQYSQLIARRIREMGVYCQLSPSTISEQDIINFAPKGIILSGGPQSVTEKDAAVAPAIVFSLGCPVLGICYGMQTMAQQLGGTVGSWQAEFGHTPIRFDKASALFRSIEAPESILNVWMSHNDHVEQLPEGFVSIAQSDRCSNAAIEHSTCRYYGIQFHAEVTNTQHGIEILKNFVFTICNVQPLWKPNNIIEESIAHIKHTVGDDHVVLAVSGGVDSSVVAALLHRALGYQVRCIFVDTGLLRFDEQQAIHILRDQLGIQLECVDASRRFLTALQGITDPEQKRKIIGHEFIEVFQEHAQKIRNARWLAQGTIYPDVIESANHVSGNKTIKSHHNVGGLPEQMHLKLLEPIKTLFKDEVRALGVELGLPRNIVYRHPFPGPGLAVRIIGEIKESYIHALRQADAIFLEELHTHQLYDTLAQAFAVFLPIQSVGVKGDVRHYGSVITLRAVTTTDFMTADWADLPHVFLTRVANRIINEISSVSRVTYDISSKPPATIEWE